MVATQEKHRGLSKMSTLSLQAFLLTVGVLVALSSEFTSVIIFATAAGSHQLCAVSFSKENLMASP